MQKIWLELGVATNMDKSISLIAGIKEVAEVGLMCFTPRQQPRLRCYFEEKATMFGKTLHRDDELLQNY
jgi:beta-glucosidase